MEDGRTNRAHPLDMLTASPPIGSTDSEVRPGWSRARASERCTAMGKRVFLFLLTNMAIVVAMSLVLSLLGFGGYLGPDGQLLIGPLAVFCFVWGMGGAFISLAISRWIAKRAMGVQLVD